MLATTSLMYLSSGAYLLMDFLSFLSTARDPDRHAAAPASIFKKQSVLLSLFLGLNVSALRVFSVTALKEY